MTNCPLRAENTFAALVLIGCRDVKQLHLANEIVLFTPFYTVTKNCISLRQSYWRVFDVKQWTVVPIEMLRWFHFYSDVLLNRLESRKLATMCLIMFYYVQSIVTKHWLLFISVPNYILILSCCQFSRCMVTAIKYGNVRYTISILHNGLFDVFSLCSSWWLLLA